MPIAQGKIPISQDGSDQGSTSDPIVKLLLNVDLSEASALSEIMVYWEVKNAIKIELIVQKVQKNLIYEKYDDIGLPSVYNVTELSESGYKVVLDRVYSTKISISATNSIETVTTSDPQIIYNSKSNSPKVGAIYNSASGFSIEREPEYFNIVKGKITLDKVENFDFKFVTSIQLLYKNEIASSWTPITLDRGSASVNEIIDNNKDVSGYSIVFNKIKINVPSIGSVIFFLVKTTATGLGDYFSKETFLFFDSLDLENSANPSSTVPDLTINQKQPAALRYEVKLKISETYKQSENSTYVKGSESGVYENSFLHLFSDFEKFKGKTSSQEAIANLFANGEYFTGFYYEATSKNSTSNNYRGLVYPACVSEILPCINITKDQSGLNASVTLFWKIIEDFYDYSFLNDEIRIATTDLQVSVQYYDGSAYQTILAPTPLKIGNKNNYNIDEDKFVLTLTRSSIDSAYLSLFDKISNLDNKNANLKIKIEKHNVTCYSPFRSVDYSFNNLLLPPRWSYLVYDEFIRSSSRDYATNTISFNLEDYALRGIRLPDRGFREFDKIEGMSYLDVDNQGGSAIVTQTVKVLYKLTSETKAFYTDPIREGTITYIDLPVKPDEVFLIAPKVQLPNPNIDSNGKLAKAEVVLNEYGKISGLKIIDPGYGYSMFKTENDKRIQVFSDLNPIVKSSYKILSTKRTEIPEFLKPVNNSFSRLKASLYGGKPLSQVGSNNAVLDDQEAKILQDYLTRNNIQQQNAAEQTNENSGSASTYINTNLNPEDETSILKLDPFWYQISKLYVDKHNNPSENVSIYNEDTDAAATEIEDSSVSSSVNSSSSAIEGSDATVLNENFTSTVKDGQTFSLSNLDIYTDASPAVSIYDTAAAPPSLTLLPLESRADGAPAYGALPNMLPRANSFFNRLVDAINNLNEVRLILPMVWSIDSQTRSSDYYLQDTEEDKNKIINFSTSGFKSTTTGNYSYYLPVNSAIGASAIRSVGRSYLKTQDLPQGITTGPGVYIKSSEYASSISFTPMIHPWMEKALQSYFIRGINKKFLAIETKRIYSCSSYEPYQENGVGFISCNGVFGVGDTYPRSIPANTNVPVDVSSETRNFKFFSYGTVSESPSGTASALALPNGIRNGYQVFCSETCGTFTNTTLDFKYSHLYPSTIKI
jgi:hypothetical protein